MSTDEESADNMGSHRFSARDYGLDPNSMSKRSGEFQSKDNTIRNSFDIIKKTGQKKFAEDDVAETDDRIKKEEDRLAETGQFNMSNLRPDVRKNNASTRLE